MTTADALVLNSPRSFERRCIEVPDPGPNEAVIRVEACGLCGTDHEQYTGHIRSSQAFVPGHEVVGVVESLGSGAEERFGVAVGQRVAVEVFRSCRTCEPCRMGSYRRCIRNGTATMTGFVGVAVESGLHGGYATHLHLTEDALVLPVPATLDPIAATLFNPLGAGIRWADELAGTKAGDVVAILGPGVRGLCCAVAAKAAGASLVMVTGYGERDAERLRLALRFGADLVVDVSVDDPVRALRSAAGRLADVVVDVTAKAPAAFAQAIRLAGVGASVVVAGTRGIAETPGFDPDHIVYKELRVLGALGVDVTAYRRALDVLASSRWPFDELTRQTAGFDDVESLLQLLAGDRDGVPPAHAVFVPDIAR